MVIELKLCRFESASWGFRLIGGADFDDPLTVIKVAEGSIAEEAGMQVGDVIVRINDTPASDLTHNDAHKIITQCGNVFFLGVARHGELPPENGADEPTGVLPTPEVVIDSLYAHTPDSMAYSDISEVTLNSCCDSESRHESVKSNVTDDHIAEMMSGEAEVLKEHNVIGVNFQKMMPKAGFCKSSEVFKTINEEAIKTQSDKEKETRKWTTFMQKPDRPIPRTRQEIEDEERRKTSGYKVTITKNLPRIQTDRPRSPNPAPIEEKPVEVAPQPPKPEPPLADSEIPDLVGSAVFFGDEDMMDPVEFACDLEPLEIAIMPPSAEETFEEDAAPPRSEEELALEQQLKDVQKQLMALSSLPSTIQATLDAVTKQLAELVPTFRLQSTPQVPLELPPKSVEGTLKQLALDELNSTNASRPGSQANQSTSAAISPEISHMQQQEPTHSNGDLEISVEDEEVQGIIEEEERILSYQELEEMQQEEERKRLEEEWTRKREKLDRWNKTWSWTENAKESIIHRNRESNCFQMAKQLEPKINFLKYKKPERDNSHLKNSEVFKVVHHLDHAPTRGIPARPELVFGEDDVRSRATPIP